MRPRRSSGRFEQESDDISRRGARPVEVPRTDAPRFLHFLLMVAARWAGRLRQKDKPEEQLTASVAVASALRVGVHGPLGFARRGARALIPENRAQPLGGWRGTHNAVYCTTACRKWGPALQAVPRVIHSPVQGPRGGGSVAAITQCVARILRSRGAYHDTEHPEGRRRT